MQKQSTYFRNCKIPVILLVCLCSSAVLLAQPMEKPVAQASSPVNVKAVAKDLNTPSFSVNMIPLQDGEKNKLMLIIENPDKKKLQVSIESPSNWNIYNEGVTKEEYRKLFDFTQAEDGIYTLVIAEGKKKIRKQININTYREQVTRKMEITEAQ